MKTFWKVFCLTILISVYNQTAKADDKPLKIAIINMQKIEQDTQASKDMQSKMTKKEQSLQNDLITRKNKIENKFKELESKRAVMSGETLQKEAKKLEAEFQKLQFDERAYSQIFEMARMFALQEMQEYVSKATNKVAAGKYDAVMPTAMFLYMDSDKFDDITKQVISKMNDISKKIDYDKAYETAQKQVAKMFANQTKTK